MDDLSGASYGVPMYVYTDVTNFDYGPKAEKNRIFGIGNNRSSCLCVDLEVSKKVDSHSTVAIADKVSADINNGERVANRDELEDEQDDCGDVDQIRIDIKENFKVA